MKWRENECDPFITFSLYVDFTSNDVDFVIQHGSRSRHIFHCSVLHLRPHVSGNVIHLKWGKGNRVKGNEI